MTPRRWGWLAMVVLLVGVLGYGGFGGDSDGSDAARGQRLQESIMCPTCRGQAVSDSDAPAAEAIRTYIGEAIARGDSDAEIRDYLVSRYGDGILLTPERSGLAGLLWVLPVVALVLALVGIGLAFRRWRHQKVTRASEDDRALVDRALHDVGATP